uniref:Uncharacterized protein n=1 Tax=Anopheles maculatus TaxID=74869 RepID=A0A182SFG5_9DIPT
MVGRLLQRRQFDGEDVLGLKVRGGQVLPSDTRAALIELESAHIRPGNYARVCGTIHARLHEGDSWCRKRSADGHTDREVSYCLLLEASDNEKLAMLPVFFL